MALTDIQIRNAKPGPKARKLADGRGLYLVVLPTGSKSWRYFYRFAGKQKTLAIGVFPDISLKVARERLQEARSLLATGQDPAFVKQREKTAKKTADKNSFEAVALEWLAKNSDVWASSHTSKIVGRLKREIFPWLGRRPIAEIAAPELLAILRRIESRGHIETAHRVHQACSRVFRYGIATGRCERDPAADLKGALAAPKTQHRASLTNPSEVGALLRAIYGFEGTYVVAAALKLLPLVFVRPGELRAAEWSEFDLDDATWRIPAERMKMRTQHIVPLSTQAVAILKELQPVTGGGQYVFPGARSPRRPLSDNTLNAALRRLGYDKEQMTAHGFRSLASTLLHERGYNRDWIERQLAHAEQNKVRAAYHHAEYLTERRQMMQDWADYLDALRDQRKVVAGSFGRSIG